MKRTITLIILMSVMHAQTIDINALRMAQSQIGLSNSTSNNTEREMNQSKSNIILDKAIDPDKYFVGPGDLFRINIIASDNISIYSLAISPTGSILIPSIGIVNINGLTLNNSINILRDKVYEIKPTAQVHIQLAEIRQFKVKIIGHLQNPGYFKVTPVTRVSDIFNQFSSYTKNKYEKEIDPGEDLSTKENIKDLEKERITQEPNNNYPKLSKRNIKIFRENDTIFVDLVKFGTLGNDKFNPYLKQGDIVFIPLKERSISIFGGIKIPGKYEYVNNENLNELIHLAGGLRKSSDPSKIEITRFINSDEKNTFSVNLNNKITIHPEDHIMIRYLKDYKRQDVVYITGEVKYPGVYSIQTGESKIKDILERSGGYTKFADQSKIFINNKSISKIPDLEEERILLIPENNRSDEEKAYIKARSIMAKGTIRSISDNQHKSLMDYNLVKDDELYIPESYNYIEILGGIEKPGRYPYITNYSIEKYLELSGGITKNATRKKFIIKAGTNQRLPINNDSTLGKGDIIFIPDKREYNSWLVFKDVLSTLASVGALVIVIQNAL